MKSQHEDVIKRINNLEATNVQLREEAQKLQAERTAYRAMVDLECQAAAGEKESQLTNAETALARIRTTRDELQADQQMRKAAQDQEKTASNHIKELAAAREERIKAVESECDRLRLQLGQEVSEKPGFDELSNEEIRSKYQALDRQYTMLNSELSSMQTAYAKASKQASQKTFDFAALEEKVLRLTAEKSKADQKYFAAMKSKESREVEVRTLRMQNAKSSDIVSQLKESEAASRSLLANLEKQLAEMKDALTTSTTQHRASQQQVAEHNIVIEGLKNQIAELKRTLNTKDTSLSATASAHRQTELENEELKSSLRDTKTSLETWKSNGLGNQTSEYEGLRVSIVLDKHPASLYQVLTSNIEYCNLHGVPEKLQEHCTQDMWSRLLQRLRRRTTDLSITKVPQLQQVLWKQRSYACHTLNDSPLPIILSSSLLLYHISQFSFCLTDILSVACSGAGLLKRKQIPLSFVGEYVQQH